MKKESLNYRTDSQSEEHKKLAYQIEFEAFKNAGGIYDERHAKLYGDLAVDMIEDGSYSIIIEGVGHACYTPMTIDEAPHLKCYIIAPLAVLTEHQGKKLATKLMEYAEKELQPDVVFVAGEKHHYGRRYSTPHNIGIPAETQMPIENWFARELTPGCLNGITSTSTVEGPYSDPYVWKHPLEQFED